MAESRNVGRRADAVGAAALYGGFAGGTPPRQENENVTATCKDYYLGCAEPTKFKRECEADITFIWHFQ